MTPSDAGPVRPDPDRPDPDRPGPRARRIAEILRVDHAGEYGAVAIYRGQHAVFAALPHKADTARLIREMGDGEVEHLETFERLIAERRTRPSLLAPFWNAAGFGLGAATALMGEKAAMACTAAVEDVIEKHYSAQIAELQETEPALSETVARFRDDELGHKHTAEAHGAEDAPFHKALYAVIGAGCRMAIRIAEKI